MTEDVKPLETKTPKDVIHAAKERGAKIVSDIFRKYREES